MNGFVNIHAIKDSLTGNLAVAVIMACEQVYFRFAGKTACPTETQATHVSEYDSAVKNSD